MRWYIAQIKYESPYLKPDRELTDRTMVFTAVPTPEPPPVTKDGLPIVASKLDRNAPWDVHSPHPPFDLEPHEIPADGSKVNPFQVLLTRQEKKEQQAERRREAKRRKAEKLRA